MPLISSKTAPVVFSAILLVAAVVSSAYVQALEPSVNPDPNHAHADFAMWVDGVQVNFGKPEYMSGLSTDATHAGAKSQFYHLHDGNGHVIHRHKNGVPIGDFFASLGMSMTPTCLRFDATKETCNVGGKSWKLFVNGVEKPFSPGFIFSDGDKLLFTYGDGSDVERELGAMTDDACLYSQTCPLRGAPPTENCVADPEVPCVE